jgi:hypothetical protein
MAAITELVADLRGETPPSVRFDPRAAGVKQIGNPRKHETGREPGKDKKRRRA